MIKKAMKIANHDEHKNSKVEGDDSEYLITQDLRKLQSAKQ